jgi:hypothetical protein
MCEYLKLKIKNWNFHVKCLEFEILKIKCLNLDVWILKFEISLWNIWKEFQILKL